MRRACPLLLLVRRFAFSSFSVTGSSASSSSTIANGGGNGAEPLRITPSAVEQLRRVSKGGECLRVCVDSGGCSGFEYKLSLDSTVNADDEVIRKEDVCVVVDKLSLEYIRGSKLDFTQDLMRSAFRITDNPAASQGCSCGMAATRLCCSRSVAICSIRSLFKPPSSISYAGVYRNSSNDGSGEESRRRDVNRYAFPTVLCIGAIATLKDVLGIERIELDKHPLKNKIKQSMYYRKYNRFDEAIQVLNEAMVEAQESKDPMFVTRVLDELANTYYEMSDLDKAEDLFKTIIQRLIQMHGKNESSPEFIGISLKLADIFARRGQLENAETGYKHCVSKQLQVLEDHKRKHLIEKGAYMEERSPVDAFGPAYTDPYVLFAMALEAYSYFLLDSFGGERVAEVEEYMDEVLKVLDEISNHVYGTCSPHSVNVINNIGARCVIAKQFKLARKYLEVGINRVLNFNECTPILVGYYCNYAEALFHTGDEAKAVEYARRAELFSRSLEDSRVRKYAERFRRDLERDARRAGVRVPASAAASTTTVNIDKNVGDDKSGDGDGGDRRSGWRRWIPI